MKTFLGKLPYPKVYSMYNYSNLRRKNGTVVSKVLHEPIVFVGNVHAIDMLLFFISITFVGIFFTSLIGLVLSVIVFLIKIPKAREKLPRGYVLHKINRFLGGIFQGFSGIKEFTRFKV